MQFGLREICDVTLRAKSSMSLGKLKFDKDMPVLYFESLKTSSLEGAATTVYAQGGKGNTRLIAWEGEKTLTFTMEDALLSKESIAVLSGADLLDASSTKENIIPVHTVEKVQYYKAEGEEGKPYIELHNVAYEDDMTASAVKGNIHTYIIPLDHHGDISGQPRRVLLKSEGTLSNSKTIRYEIDWTSTGTSTEFANYDGLVLVDYYVGRTTGVTEITITPEKFAGYYYLEASTLFRNKDGVDLPAEFIIPNCKIQSNFTFSMAATGDPSTFTFTLDAFPDYTKYGNKKVLAAIQVIEETDTTVDTQVIDGTYEPKASGGTNTQNGEETPSPGAGGGSYRTRNSILNSKD